jgi:hypothetical protein
VRVVDLDNGAGKSARSEWFPPFRSIARQSPFGSPSCGRSGLDRSEWKRRACKNRNHGEVYRSRSEPLATGQRRKGAWLSETARVGELGGSGLQHGAVLRQIRHWHDFVLSVGGRIADRHVQAHAAAPAGTRAAASPNELWDVEQQTKLGRTGEAEEVAIEGVDAPADVAGVAVIETGDVDYHCRSRQARTHRPEHQALDITFAPEDLIEIDRLTLVDEDRSVAPVYRKLRPENVQEFESRQVSTAKTRQ